MGGGSRGGERCIPSSSSKGGVAERAAKEAAKGAAAGWREQTTDEELTVWFEEKHGARASGGRWTDGFVRVA